MTDSRPPDRAEGTSTVLVETDSGELVERLSFGTATLLLVWLIITGAGSALLAAWVLARVVLNAQLGSGALLGEFGFYIGLYGAMGPCVLWLTGRAQGHALRWFAWTAARIGLFMAGLTLVFGAMVTLVLGAGLTAGTGVLGAAVVLATLVLSQAWGLTTWAADLWIASARVERPARD